MRASVFAVSGATTRRSKRAEVRVRIVGRRSPGERGEGLTRDEALRAGGEDGLHLVPGTYEQTNERAGLVGRDPPGHSEQDACHGPR